MPTPAPPPEHNPWQLSASTRTYLDHYPAARYLVTRVWTTLTELHRSGRCANPTGLAALFTQLLEHQPSPRTGRCHACPRRHSHYPHWSWRHPHFPCMVWITTDLRLHDPLRGTRRLRVNRRTESELSAKEQPGAAGCP